MDQIFEWIASNYPNAYELIYSPKGNRQLYHGAPHYYGEPTRGDHWDHVHWSMANGGLVKGGRGGVMAHIGEGRHDELVTPLPAGGLGGMGGGTTINVTVNAAIADAGTGQIVVDAIRQYERRNGRSWRN